MKNIFVLLIFFYTGLVTISAQNNWEWITPYPTGNTSEFSCEKDGYVFYLGFPKSFCATKDGGETFITNNPYTKVTDSYPEFINRMTFTDSLTGFIADDDGIYKTTDGGKNWSRIVNGFSLLKIVFGDKTTGWIIDEWGISISKDGGNSWNPMKVNGLYGNNTLKISKIYALNNKRLWIC
ncbi:MAG: hypothetical protein P8Z35_19035, partial [Ignavibacteriaceae bacterium]